MEMKDLMLNDWVKLKNHKGEWINNSKISPNLMEVLLRDHDDPYVILEPIELTDQLLDKNDYEFSPVRDLAIKTVDNIQLNIYPSDGSSIFEISSEQLNIRILINYVHELQHILRLCGLSEEADNFKV